MAWTDKWMTAAGGGAHDGSSEANAWTMAECIAAPYAAGQRINVKAGTYASAATNRTFGVAATTTAPCWFRGYKTTPGDLDDGVTIARSLQDGVNLPLWTFTTAQIGATGAHHIFSNIDITGQCINSGGAFAANGSGLRLIYCRIENTANNANSCAVRIGSGSNLAFVGCRFKSHTGSSGTVLVPFGNVMVMGCVVIGGAVGVTVANTPGVIAASVIYGFATTGISLAQSSTPAIVSRNTIYAAATNGILITAVPATGLSLIDNNIIGGCTNGINQNTGTDSNFNFVLRNHFYDCTNNLVGFTETATVGSDLGILYKLLDEDTDPFVSKATGDFTLAAAAIDKSAGWPGVFEGQTAMVGYPDIGAVRHIDPAGGGGRPEFRNSNL